MSDFATPVLSVDGLTKHFPIRRGVFSRTTGWVRAVDDVTFQIGRGEVVALVGESGSGKTTVARTVIRLLRPTSGTIILEGEDISDVRGASLRAVHSKMQMVFQDPFGSLDPRMTVASTIAEALQIHGIGGAADRRDRVHELLRRVGLSPDLGGRYPHEFSGGQRQRVGIARALAVKPALLIADEPVSALDVSVQAQVVNLLQDLCMELGLSILFVAHDLGVVEHIADRVVVMYLGHIMESAPSRILFSSPRHPYTEALLAAVPAPVPGRNVNGHSGASLPGELPSPVNPPSGCVFRTRCPIAAPECADVVPELRPAAASLDASHQVACLKR